MKVVARNHLNLLIETKMRMSQTLRSCGHRIPSALFSS